MDAGGGSQAVRAPPLTLTVLGRSGFPQTETRPSRRKPSLPGVTPMEVCLSPLSDGQGANVIRYVREEIVMYPSYERPLNRHRNGAG